jgi:polyhydroxybutyrate depolymerase
MRVGLALLALLLPTLASGALAPGDYARTIEFQGRQRDWILHVPPGYDGATPVPLVLDIHGLSSNNQQQRGVSGIGAVADREGFLVVWPNGWNAAWNAGVCCGNTDLDDVAFLRDVVARTAGETRVDPQRVYATGISNGGAMSQRLACDAADLFAAAVPTAFPLPFADFADCRPSRPIPVLTVMGLTDKLVPYEGGAFASAADTFAFWRDQNGCTGEKVTVPYGVARCETFSQCDAGVEVGLCSVVAQAFPGLPIDGHVLYLNDQIVVAEEAWRFLSRFRLPTAPAPAPATLTGTARLRFGNRKGAPEPVTWTASVGAGTWSAIIGDGATLTGSVRDQKRARTVALTPSTVSWEVLEADVTARIESLTGTTGWQITLDPASPLRITLDRQGVPRALRGTLRIRRGDAPGATVGKLTLALKRA